MLGFGFTGQKAYEWKQAFIDDFEIAVGYIDRRTEAYKDPPRTAALDSKRAAHTPMMDALIESRSELGKETEQKHFQCENKLCNWCITGKFAAIEESALSNEDAALLEKVRTRNAALIVAGREYEERKPLLQAYAMRERTKAIAMVAA